MSQDEAINHIRNGRICGFVEVSLFTPDNQIHRFLDLPPLCAREIITRKELKGKQKLIAERRSLLKCGQTTIVSKFAVENTVIDTDLFNWYIENGIQVSRLETIIQFSENKTFKVLHLTDFVQFFFVYTFLLRNGLETLPKAG